MLRLSRRFRLWLAAAGFAAGALPAAWAQLAESSPFAPADGGAAAAAAAAAAASGQPVELRGIMTTSAGTRYCIYDNAKKSSRWVALNEDTGASFVVRAANEANDQVTVDYQGSSLVLTLREAKVASSSDNGAGQSSAAMHVSDRMRPPPMDEAKRLRAIADEIRQRRQMRAQLLGRPGS